MFSRITSVFFGLCLAVGGFAVLAGGDDYPHARPAYQQFRLTLEQGERTEIAGPFWSRETVWDLPTNALPPAPDPLSPPTELTPLQKRAVTVGLAPFFSWEKRFDVESLRLYILYPVISYTRYGGEYRFQIGQLLSWAGGGEPSGHDTRRTTLFPIYWRQRSGDPALNYTAVFPFYGNIQRHLFRDEIHFVMWPFYVQTRKRDVVTDNYLVPFVHVRHGTALTGWQAWPFVGVEHKDPQSLTNRYGDAEVVGGHDKLFVLWPLFFHNNIATGTTNELHERGLLPFFASETSPARDTHTYLWPVGVKLTDDRAERYRETTVAWPIAVFGRGEKKRMDRLFPLFGRTRTPEKDDRFYLWPVFREDHRSNAVADIRRTSLLMWVYTDSRVLEKASGRVEWRHDFWPLFIHRHDRQGNERFQLFAPLEPVLGLNEGIARSWSPLWSVWRAESNKQTGVRSQSLLWNLYRHESAPGGKKGSLLFGLIQYHSTPAGTRWRLFYLPGGKAKAAAAPHPAGGS